MSFNDAYNNYVRLANAYDNRNVYDKNAPTFAEVEKARLQFEKVQNERLIKQAEAFNSRH